MQKKSNISLTFFPAYVDFSLQEQDENKSCFLLISQTTEMFYSNTGITFVCMVGLDQIKQGNNCYHYYYFISRFNIHIYCLFQHLPARPLCGDICECITRPILMQEMTEEGPKTSLCSRETL